MEIIPVIDILKGQVVQAKGGERAAYQPLESQLTAHTDIIGAVGDLLAFYPFKTLYIADLDVIMGGEFDCEPYQALVATFPQLTIWLDAGIQTKEDWQAISAVPNVQTVIGSETLQDKALLVDDDIRAQSILSLDYRAGQILGNKYLPDQIFWPEQIIIMNLDTVGADKGPDLGLLTSLSAQGDQQWIMAGGVRDARDLDILREQGVAGVLIASALHSGAIQKTEI